MLATYVHMGFHGVQRRCFRFTPEQVEEGQRTGFILLSPHQTKRATVCSMHDCSCAESLVEWLPENLPQVDNQAYIEYPPPEEPIQGRYHRAV